MSPEVPTWVGVAASVVLVLLAAAITGWQRLGITREILVAGLRAFVQLLAVGAVLSFLFGHAGLLGALAWLTGMVVVAGVEASRRAKGMPVALRTATTGIAVGAVTTLGVLLVLGVIAFQPRVVVPVGGMVDLDLHAGGRAGAARAAHRGGRPAAAGRGAGCPSA